MDSEITCITVTNASVDAQPLIESCNLQQISQINRVFYYTRLELIRLSLAIQDGNQDPAYKAMFKTSSNEGALSSLFRCMYSLRPVPASPDQQLRFQCAENHPLILRQCNDGLLYTISYPVIPTIWLCPRFFGQPISPSPESCPAVYGNRFIPNPRGRAFGYGAAWDIISALVSVYTNSAPEKVRQPLQAVIVINKALDTPASEAARNWKTLAGYVLRELPAENLSISERKTLTALQ